VITPYVDFTSLDLVGVVVPKGTKSDRTVITAGPRTTPDRTGGR
jgi:rod shape-determining protein MreC